MKPCLWLIIAIFPLLSCTKLLNGMLLLPSKTISPGFIEYTILKGSHDAKGNVFKQIHKTAMRFQVIFDSSAIYYTIKDGNQYDINKLYGFSDCRSQHHENSARFGWRWNGNSLEIHAYWYNDSVRYHAFLDTVSIGTTTELAITVLPDQYGFEINKKSHLFPRHCNSPVIHGYQLYPYFGGDETAPHNINIRIKEIE